MSPYFSGASPKLPYAKYITGILLNKGLDALGMNKGYNKTGRPLDRTGDTTKGVGFAKFDFTKTFRNQVFSCVMVLYHQYSITNRRESILKSKTIDRTPGGFFPP